MASAVTPGATSNTSTKKYIDLPDGRFVFKITDVTDVMSGSFKGDPPQPQWRFRVEVPTEYHDRIVNPDMLDGYEQGTVCSVYAARKWGFFDKSLNEWKHSNASLFLSNCLGARATEVDLMPILLSKTTLTPDVFIDMHVEGDVTTRAKRNDRYVEGGEEPEEVHIASLRPRNTRYLADMIEANRDIFHRRLRDFNAPAYDAIFPTGKLALGRAPAKKATKAVADETATPLAWEKS